MIDKLEDKSVSVTINAKGIIISCNQTVEELFGYKPSGMVGNHITLIMNSPHKERHDYYIQNFLKEGKPKVIGHVRSVSARHKNGMTFPVSVQVEHVKMGNIELFRGKIERVDTMEAVFTIDEEGTIVSCNQNFVLPMFGYSNRELTGRNISILIPEISQSTDEEKITEPNTKKRKTSCIMDSWKITGVHRKELRHKDGSVFPVNLEVFSFRATDGSLMYSGRIQRADAVDTSGEDGQQKWIGDYKLANTIGHGTYGKGIMQIWI